MTGLWDAKVDRAPVLALTGQVDVQVFGPVQQIHGLEF
jgi:thiamine pyrophosphate-dependent acetolactate synthase large subunit-like protein